jgi:hypothetical protein
MSLVLALKNDTSIIMAADGQSEAAGTFSSFMSLPNRAVLLMAGNLEFIEDTIMSVVPKIDLHSSAASVAQLVQAALVVDVVPHLEELKGRTEVLVAGFDQIHHQAEPGLYYMDSAQDFYLQVVSGSSVVAGATAAANEQLASYDLAGATTEQLQNLAKDCVTATKLRWPEAVTGDVRIGTLTADGLQVISA